MRAGQLNRRIVIKKPVEGRDGFGQPIKTMVQVGQPIMAGIANETGLGAIRAGLQSDVPASIARYSFVVRFATAKAMAIDETMIVEHDGDVFEIKGVTRDYSKRDRAFLVCEQGGNRG